MRGYKCRILPRLTAFRSVVSFPPPHSANFPLRIYFPARYSARLRLIKSEVLLSPTTNNDLTLTGVLFKNYFSEIIRDKFPPRYLTKHCYISEFSVKRLRIKNVYKF